MFTTKSWPLSFVSTRWEKQLGERNKRRVLAAADAVGEAFDSAYVRSADGGRERVPVHRLMVGDVVEVAPGERRLRSTA